MDMSSILINTHKYYGSLKVNLMEGHWLIEADLLGEAFSTECNLFFFILTYHFLHWAYASGSLDKSDPYAIITWNKQTVRNKTMESNYYKNRWHTKCLPAWIDLHVLIWANLEKNHGFVLIKLSADVGSNPIWNKWFLFDINGEATELSIELFDRDKILNPYFKNSR